MPHFPITRLRRNRYENWTRTLIAENILTPNDLIWPIFIHEGQENVPISSMPGVIRMNIKNAVERIKFAASLGIQGIALFPAIDPALKDAEASYAFSQDSFIYKAIKEIKNQISDIGIICDVALDPYTNHGHDGIILNNDVDNDLTNEKLCEYAVNLAAAGANAVAPSDMMDGRIGLIRKNLDINGFYKTLIISYAVKFASNFYGPFRESVGSAANFGSQNKKTYQMDFRNSKEALREIELDIKEGADFIMIKPGMPYLDIIKEAQKFNVPIFAYQVSGEYAMLKFAANAGCLEYLPALYESLISFKRAGACGIFTYGAVDIAEFLNK